MNYATIEQAIKYFKRHNIPEHLYVSRGELGAGECFGVEEKDSSWYTYYSEHGQKSDIRKFPNQAEAVTHWVASVESHA